MTPKLFRVILPVSDIARAAEFYSGVLGQPGMRISGGRLYFDCGGVLLACFDPQADGDGYSSRPNSEHIYFAVDDLEATRSACLLNGADLSRARIHDQPGGEIALRPWGERSFYCHDPFDNPLCFVDRTTLFTGAAPGEGC